MCCHATKIEKTEEKQTISTSKTKSMNWHYSLKLENCFLPFPTLAFF